MLLAFKIWFGFFSLLVALALAVGSLTTHYHTKTEGSYNKKTKIRHIRMILPTKPA